MNGCTDASVPFDADVRKLAEHARSLIEELHPDVVEARWPHEGVTGYGAGPMKTSGHSCVVACHRDHVKLGGLGEMLRHTRITSPGGQELPALRALLIAGPAHRAATTPASARGRVTLPGAPR